MFYYETMKKFALSALVVMTFLVYSYHQRHEQVSKPLVSASAPSASTPDAQSSAPTQSGTPVSTGSGQYKDGNYTGSVADAFYGNVQVQAVVRMGRVVAVTFLQHPSDNSTSRVINRQAMPILMQEAVQAQSASVDTVTGATDTSMAFIQSLTAALASAH